MTSLKRTSSRLACDAKVSCDVKVVHLALDHEFGLSRGVVERASNVLVRLQLKGHTGYGEAAPNRRYGESPDQTIDAVHKFVHSIRNDLLQSARTFLDGIEGQHQLWLENFSDPGKSAMAAIDCALWDLIARQENTSVAQLMQLAQPLTPPTSFSIGLSDPETMAQRVAEAAHYPILKIKLGGPNDRSIIEAIRRVTKQPLRVDMNEGWRDRDQAARMVEWLETQQVELIEQPFPARFLDETRWLRSRTKLPVIADEAFSGPDPFIQIEDAFDGVNIKIDKCGGLTPGRALMKRARALGLKTMVGCMVASSLSITAAAHLGVDADYVDLDGHLLLSEDPFRGVSLQPGGELHLPSGIGLGVSVSNDRIVAF